MGLVCLACIIVVIGLMLIYSGPAVRWVVGALVVFVAAGIFFPLTSNHGGRRLENYCRGNLWRLGMAIQQYASDYGDALPDQGLWQVADYAWDSRIFFCPNTGSNRRNNPDSADQVVTFAATTLRIELTRADTSYRYFGAGLKGHEPGAERIIIAGETVARHRKETVLNVLFLDGHVTAEQAQSLPELCVAKGYVLGHARASVPAAAVPASGVAALAPRS